MNWLITGGVGPALVALPINWTAGQLASASQRWFARLRHSDGLSRLVQAAGASTGLTSDEFAAVRKLLRDPQSWDLIRNGTVEDLASKIDSCLLSTKANRSDSVTAARAIARGILEFAVFDLEPGLFQRVLIARLARMESRQLAALDSVMLSLHADLVAWFAQQSQDEEQWFRRLMTQLGQILDRLPPAAAGREEVAIYLAALIWWLSSDPWPRDPRLHGPILTPAAIERELTITGADLAGEWDVDADELARYCTRLVVLGGPGSGKTWLARRAARRCAEIALEALIAGAGLDETELPLFTTCSYLVSERGNIRYAAVTSALDQLGDLGGSRITDSLSVFFTERNAPTLLVIDSLDEARSPDARLRQADTLPWRIVLTSRPSSWKQQLAINQANDAHRVGSLRPLRYPADVESFIMRWFTQRPSWGEVLVAQIERRPDLQQAATVPLILAFCCIIGGDQPLPATRRELYALVLRRILTGLWRGTEGEAADPEVCTAILRDWAWTGATSDPVSGIGTWADEIPAAPVHLNQSNQAAVDHVAAPLSLENLDTGMTLRRFIHRSIREHLTAEHIAMRTNVGQAAAELLNHLWYDLDWEYVAPAALVMHPQRDQVLQEVICHAAGLEPLSQDLSPIDGCRELRRFLARVAAESTEADWMAESAAIISRARLDLAADGSFADLGSAPGWESSNHPIRQMLLAMLTSRKDSSETRDLAETLTRLVPDSAEREQAGHKLLALLARETDPWEARDLARILVRLVPDKRAQVSQALLGLLGRGGDAQSAGILAITLAGLGPDARKLARQALVALIARQYDPHEACDLVMTLAGLEPDPDERKETGQALLALLARQSDPWKAQNLARTLAGLEPDPDEREKAGQALLALLARRNDPWRPQDLEKTLAGLRPDDQERARRAVLTLIAPPEDPREAWYLARKLARLNPSPSERARAERVLSALLTRQSDMQFAGVLAGTLAGLNPDERTQAFQMLLALMAEPEDPRETQDSMRIQARLNPDPAEQAQIRQVLISLLARQSDPQFARVLAPTLAKLDPNPTEQKLVRQTLLSRLARQGDPWKARALAEALASLDLDPAERAHAGQLLLAWLARLGDPWKARELAEAVAALDPEKREQARQALLVLLAREGDAKYAIMLAQALATLDPYPAERTQIREALLTLLARQSEPGTARELAEAMVRLDSNPAERARARQALLALLARQSDPRKARDSAKPLATLDPDPTERTQASEALLNLLARERDAQFVIMLAETLAGLGQGELKQAKQALLAQLARETNPWKARDLAEALARLNPDSAERAQAGQALLTQQASQDDPWKVQSLAKALVRLNLGPEDSEQVAEALIVLITRETDAEILVSLAETLAALGLEERKMARQALLRRLVRETSAKHAATLVDVLSRLKPDVQVLENWQSWVVPADRDLLTETRRNSTLSSWLEVLPKLRALPAQFNPEPHAPY